MKIYIIAGEASGDIYGAGLIRSLRKKSPSPIEFYGIGGERMAAEGFSSLFPMSDLSIMGFLEIVPHIGSILTRIEQTVSDIKRVQPNIVITIDSPGFCCRVAKKLKGQEGILEKCLSKLLVKHEEDEQNEGQEEIPFTTPPLLHYVAPTVWAYKPERAQKFADIFDHLLVILPFEPPYFEAVGLPCTFIGHPITETKFPADGSSFREKYNIDVSDTLICVMPGSRKGEVSRLLPVFLNTIGLLTSAANIKIAIPTIPSLKSHVERIVDSTSIQAIILDTEQDKLACYKAANAALVKSGTGTIEVALAGCPMIIGYKVNFISHKIIKAMVKIKFANLINLILDEELIPEFLQQYCTPYLMAQQLDKIISDNKIRDNQIARSQQVLQYMGLGSQTSPSENAAEEVLKLVNKQV